MVGFSELLFVIGSAVAGVSRLLLSFTRELQAIENTATNANRNQIRRLMLFTSSTLEPGAGWEVPKGYAGWQRSR